LKKNKKIEKIAKRFTRFAIFFFLHVN